jgi:hypothetical protein
MKLKVQRDDSEIIVGGCMNSLKEAKEGGCDILVEDGPSVYKMAIEILEAHPRFKEIIINTELTDDGEDNH